MDRGGAPEPVRAARQDRGSGVAAAAGRGGGSGPAGEPGRDGGPAAARAADDDHASRSSSAPVAAAAGLPAPREEPSGPDSDDSPYATPDLLYSEEEEALRSAVRGLLADHCDPAAVLARSASDAPHDRELWRLLAEDMGLAGLLVPEEFGGQGATHREAAVVLEELGRAVAPVPFLTSAVMATEALLWCVPDALVPGAPATPGPGNAPQSDADPRLNCSPRSRPAAPSPSSPCRCPRVRPPHSRASAHGRSAACCTAGSPVSPTLPRRTSCSLLPPPVCTRLTSTRTRSA